jgi:hypothetical protein
MSKEFAQEHRLRAVDAALFPLGLLHRDRRQNCFVFFAAPGSSGPERSQFHQDLRQLSVFIVRLG